MKKFIILFTLLLTLTLIVTSCKDETITAPPDKPAPQLLNDSLTANELVIYEMFVRNFTNEGTFNAIVPRLDELKQLGINTIWLMPIHPIGVVKKLGTYGSPYAVKDYYAVNPNMGTSADFKNLVNEVHNRGMLLIIDWVANHTSWDNPWITAHSDWYTKDAQGNIVPPISNWQDVADLNFNNLEMRNEMIKAMKFWVTEYNIDGFRCDAAEMVPNDFWNNAITDLRAIRPLFLLGEGESKNLLSQGFDAIYSWTEYGAIKDIFMSTRTSTYTNYINTDLNALPVDKYRLRFTTNHDETSWDLTPPEIYGGIQGAMAASVISFASKGIPMLYNGQEVGSTVHQNLFEKSQINWNANPEMKQFYTKLISIYNSNVEFTEGSLEIINLSEELVSFKRTKFIGIVDGQEINSNVWIIVNPNNTVKSFNIPNTFLSLGLENLFTGEVLTGKTTLQIPAYGYYIFRIK